MDVQADGLVLLLAVGSKLSQAGLLGLQAPAAILHTLPA